MRRRLADSCGSGSSRSSGSWWSGSDGGSADAAAEDDAKLLTALADWAGAESGSNAQLMVRGSACAIHVAATIFQPENAVEDDAELVFASHGVLAPWLSTEQPPDTSAAVSETLRERLMSALLADLWGALEPHVVGTHLEPLLQLPPGGLLNGHPAKQIGDADIWVPADAERRDSGCGSVGSRPSTSVASESSDEAPLINLSGDDPRGSEKAHILTHLPKCCRGAADRATQRTCSTVRVFSEYSQMTAFYPMPIPKVMAWDTYC